MPVSSQILDTAKDGKFSEFSDAVKQELKQKLSSHKVTKQYVSDYDKVQQMKTLFADVAKTRDDGSADSQ